MEYDTLFITRHALTEGIVVRKGRVSSSGIAQLDTGEYLLPYDFGKTKEEALAMADEMRTKRIASLESQLKKLKAMTFTIPALPDETQDN